MFLLFNHTHTHTHKRRTCLATQKRCDITQEFVDGWQDIYIYIYIYTNLISTSIHGTRKKEKKNRQEQNIRISRITARGKKKKYYRSTRKKRPTSSDPLKKINQGICSQLVKRKLKPSANPAMLQLQECSTRVEHNYKINLNRESEIFY